MRFVGILAIEGEAQSAVNAHFWDFLLFPATTEVVSRLKFRNAARLYSKKLSRLRSLIRPETACWEVRRLCDWFLKLGFRPALLVSSAAAFAAPALVLSDLNIRAGPGMASPVVITVPGGSTVDVLECDPSGWCSVRI